MSLLKNLLFLLFLCASTSFSINAIAGDTVCGNGIKGPAEDCDDGNAFNGDGCTSDDCTVEALWTCTAVENETSLCSLIAMCGLLACNC